MGIGKNGERSKMFLQHRKALIEYATPLVGSKEEAEDIVQDAYLRFIPEPSEAPLPPKAYLFRIVRNLSFNKRARRKLERAVQPDDIAWWAKPGTVETPENDLLYCEQIKSISAALDEMPGKTKRVMEMYRFDGLTLAEISGQLGISVATAHRLVKEAMAMIKAKMPHDQ